MGLRVVVVMLKTEFVVHFSWESVEGSVWVITSVEGSFDVLMTVCSPMCKCIVDTVFVGDAVMAVPV